MFTCTVKFCLFVHPFVFAAGVWWQKVG